MAKKSKSLLKHGFKAEAERISERLRKELKISKFAPLCAFALAEHLGVTIAGITEVLPKEGVNKLNDPSKKEKFSGLLFKNEDGDPVVLHNDLDSKKRQQSNLMHELAHFLCGHEVPEEIRNLIYLYNLRYFNAEHEAEAKYLGGCLQIPKPGLLWKRKEQCSEEEISEYFSASVDMVNYRINTLGLNRRFKRN